MLSKVDLMDKYGDLDFNLEYYADVQDLHYLADRMLGENDEPEGGAFVDASQRESPVGGHEVAAQEVRA